MLRAQLRRVEQGTQRKSLAMFIAYVYPQPVARFEQQVGAQQPDVDGRRPARNDPRAFGQRQIRVRVDDVTIGCELRARRVVGGQEATV